MWESRVQGMDLQPGRVRLTADEVGVKPFRSSNLLVSAQFR